MPRLTHECLRTEDKQPRGGRPKKKEQISVRMDRAVDDLVRAYLDRNKTARKTDLLERGLLLAVREAERTEPEFINAGISLNDMPVEAAQAVIDLRVLRYLAERGKLTPMLADWYEYFLKTLKGVKEWPGYAEALKKLASEGKWRD